MKTLTKTMTATETAKAHKGAARKAALANGETWRARPATFGDKRHEANRRACRGKAW